MLHSEKRARKQQFTRKVSASSGLCTLLEDVTTLTAGSLRASPTLLGDSPRAPFIAPTLQHHLTTAEQKLPAAAQCCRINRVVAVRGQARPSCPQCSATTPCKRRGIPVFFACFLQPVPTQCSCYTPRQQCSALRVSLASCHCVPPGSDGSSGRGCHTCMPVLAQLLHSRCHPRGLQRVCIHPQPRQRLQLHLYSRRCRRRTVWLLLLLALLPGGAAAPLGGGNCARHAVLQGGFQRCAAQQLQVWQLQPACRSSRAGQQRQHARLMCVRIGASSASSMRLVCGCQLLSCRLAAVLQAGITADDGCKLGPPAGPQLRREGCLYGAWSATLTPHKLYVVLLRSSLPLPVLAPIAAVDLAVRLANHTKQARPASRHNMSTGTQAKKVTWALAIPAALCPSEPSAAPAHRHQHHLQQLTAAHAPAPPSASLRGMRPCWQQPPATSPQRPCCCRLLPRALPQPPPVSWLLPAPLPPPVHLHQGRRLQAQAQTGSTQPRGQVSCLVYACSCMHTARRRHSSGGTWLEAHAEPMKTRCHSGQHSLCLAGQHNQESTIGAREGHRHAHTAAAQGDAACMDACAITSQQTNVETNEST